MKTEAWLDVLHYVLYQVCASLTAGVSARLTFFFTTALSSNVSTCEMKRLYVRPQARGQNLGRRLADAVVQFARQARYSRVVLDSLSSMQTAQKLYMSMGFYEIPPYYDNPLLGAVYLALDL